MDDIETTRVFFNKAMNVKFQLKQFDHSIFKIWFFKKELLSVKALKSKKERKDKLNEIIGEYPTEILTEIIRALKTSHNYSLVESNSKSCAKLSTLNMASMLSLTFVS